MSEALSLSKRLKSHNKFHRTISKGVELIKATPDHEKLRLSINITEMIGCLVENEIAAKYKLDKSMIVVDILNKVYNLSKDEISTIEEQICYLIEHKRIRKEKWFRYIKRNVKDLLFNFFFVRK